MSIKIKRIYDEPEKSDGKRILVDRLWPRGVSKEKADLDLWLKDIAPSPQLRTWFSHSEEKFPEFTEEYMAELADDPLKQKAVDDVVLMGKKGMVTLLYGAKSPTINHAAVLKQFIDKKSK